MKSAGPPLDPNRGSPSSGSLTIGDRALGVERSSGYDLVKRTSVVSVAPGAECTTQRWMPRSGGSPPWSAGDTSSTSSLP